MAVIIFGESTCPLCDQALEETDNIFGTWGVWLPDSDRLSRFCDAAMHWACYAEWKYQRRFARSYFDFWVRGRNANRFWRPVFLDDSVLVTVNDEPPVEAAWVYLSATGTRYCPKLNDWEEWLQQDGKDLHPVELAAISLAKQTLRADVPTKESLLGRKGD